MLPTLHVSISNSELVKIKKIFALARTNCEIKAQIQQNRTEDIFVNIHRLRGMHNCQVES